MISYDILALIIAGAALLAPIIGPIITVRSANRHERNMYQKRFVTEHAHEVIEKYLQSAGRYVFEFEHKDLSAFGEAASEIFMYAPADLTKDLKKFNAEISRISQIDDYGSRVTELKKLQAPFLALCEKFASLRRVSECEKQTNANRRRKK